MTVPEEIDQLRSADLAILEELCDQRLEYVALLANRRGLHLSYARERCRTLERRGLIERATDEVTYRLTERGEVLLEAVPSESGEDTVACRVGVPE